MAELKPCPFCESEDMELNVNEVTSSWYDSWVFCRSCNATGPLAKSDNKKDAERLAMDKWNLEPRRNELIAFPKDANNNDLRLGEDVIDIQTGRKLITQAFEITSFHPTGDLVIRCYDPKRGGETLHNPKELALYTTGDRIHLELMTKLNACKKELASIETFLKNFYRQDNK